MPNFTPPQKIVVTQLDPSNYLLWVDDQQRSSFTESQNYGPNGFWNGPNWYGPSAKDRATYEANCLGDRFGVKVQLRL